MEAGPLPESVVAAFLKQVGRGRMDDVRASLAGRPALVNAVGPHPFWGGRAQALHVAVETRRPEMVALLIERGADVNGANAEYDHWSPLMLAIDRDRPDIREQLLAAGARIGLLEALMLGDDRRVDEMLRGGLPAILPNGGSILAFARTPFAIDLLLALGAPTDLADRWGSRPIDALSRLGPRGRPLVERLVAHGVEAGPAESARLGDLAKLQQMAQSDGASVRRDEVLMAAVDFGHHDIVRWLIGQGASVDARAPAPSRHTALHSAAWNGDLEMVRLLLHAGANGTLRDEEHDGTPRDWADVAVEVTNNRNCGVVAAYLRSRGL
ncbi:MAG TPA: ankyrin repeat domain-containing protein [Vicinamibacterales bacterium]